MSCFDDSYFMGMKSFIHKLDNQANIEWTATTAENYLQIFNNGSVRGEAHQMEKNGSAVFVGYVSAD